ncbi:hypothetical protein L218DRAFT_962381 [Marasmius fiardii PR-910]|nr:hypothetical protein L218DRAFT_962381 [Marasmius fiardii PR-910]
MTTPSPEEIAEHIRLIKMFSLSSFVVLTYDFALTFADEIEYIWNRKGLKFNWMTVLWCVNRYLWPPAFIVIIVALHDPYWSDVACQRYVWYPQAIRLCVTVAVGIYFIILVRAVYFSNNYVTVLSSFLLITEIAMKIWATCDIKGARLEDYTGCYATSRHPPNHQFVYGYVSELVFDSLMLAAIAYRCYSLGIKNSVHIRVLWEESILYLPVIFVIHLANVLIYNYAPYHLKNTMTSFSTIGCSVVVSHMMLNTRKASKQDVFPTSAWRPDDVESPTFPEFRALRTAFDTNAVISIKKTCDNVSVVIPEFSCGTVSDYESRTITADSHHDSEFLTKTMLDDVGGFWPSFLTFASETASDSESDPEIPKTKEPSPV